MTAEQIERLREIIQHRLDYHCDKTKYRYELGKGCIQSFINDIVKDFTKELNEELISEVKE